MDREVDKLEAVKRSVGGERSLHRYAVEIRINVELLEDINLLIGGANFPRHLRNAECRRHFISLTFELFVHVILNATRDFRIRIWLHDEFLFSLFNRQF